MDYSVVLSISIIVFQIIFHITVNDTIILTINDEIVFFFL